MTRYVNCNLCGGNDTKLIQPAEKPFKVVQCKDCGLVYTNPQPDLNLVEDHYVENYYREWIHKQMARRIPMWKKRLQELKVYKKGGCLLDVGCGLGTFLKVAGEDGFEVWATEISDYASRYIKDELRIKVFKGRLEDIKLPFLRFDIITFWHSLEHVPDPLADLKLAHRLLKKDGLLIIACPNLNNFITRVLYLIAKRKKLKLFSNQAKELHLYHFSEKTITLMLEKAGFRVMKMDMDLAQIELNKKIVDWLTVIFHLITHKNFGEALKVYARKEK